jgi:4-amino-4-deoxy-L-arabinose transferase-like glycosyltransferase
MKNLDSKKLLYITIGVTFLLKSLLAYTIPLTGDEAYFYTWGTFPDFGYYDHPPMVGWLLAIILKFSSSEYALRLPPLIFPYVIGAAIYSLLQSRNKNLASWTVILFLVSPLNMINILVTTDTPLMLFVSLSSACFYHGLHKNKPLYLIAAGAFLGGAFLAKYLSAVLVIAYVVYMLIYQRNQWGVKALFIMAICAMPFGLLNVYYNYTHAWSNIMFNVYNRNQDIGAFKPLYFLSYLGQLLFLLTPVVIYYLLRYSKTAMKITGSDHLRQYYSVLFLVPIGIFAILSFTKPIGLHWPLAFLPFLFILTFFHFSEVTFQKSRLLVAIFTFTFNILLSYILISPPAQIAQSRIYQQSLFYIKPQAMANVLKPYSKDYVFSTESYSKSAVLYYYTQEYVSVFGKGSYHARHDDMYTDFRNLNGKNIIIFRTKRADKALYTPYFQEVTIEEIKLDGILFYLVEGKDFKYDVYREQILRPIKNKFYDIPKWLPMSENYFIDKYFAK